MKKISYLSLLFFITFLLSCSDDDTHTPSLPEVAIENLSDEVAAAQEDTVYLKAKIKSLSDSKFKWAVNGEPITNATDSVFKFVKKEVGDYTITLSTTNIDGEVSAKVDIHVYGKFRDGTFILNEGNMTTENGSLVFISPKGIITDSAYFKVNGSQLGNVTQDLFISKGKMYIISQNGRKNPVGTTFENDGMLVVANAETLKKEAAYNDELSVLSWPTHLAVLGQDNIFIRDNNGVYLFNTSSKQLDFVAGSKGATKNRMAVVDGKVFVPCKRTVLVLESGKKEVSHTIDMGATVTGVIPSYDGNVWVATTGSPNKISKVNPKDYSIIQANTISQGNVGIGGMAATPGITAIKDTLYFSNLGPKIYRHIFSTGVTDFLVDAKTMVDNANIVYNTIAVHPLTGKVYMNTLQAYLTFDKNNKINIFNFQGTEPKLSASYLNHTRFPAGIFFTYDFK